MLKMFIYKFEDMEGVRDADVLATWEAERARRAANAAGLIGQASFAKTAEECVNACANYAANFNNKGYAIIDEWFDAFGNKFSRSKKLAKIWEREFFGGPEFSVGEYLELINN